MTPRGARIGSVAATLLAISGVALAQTAPQADPTIAPPKQTVREAMRDAMKNGGAMAESVLELQTEEGRLRVHLQGDVVTATINDRPFPANRLRLEPNAVVVLDRGGRAIATMNHPVVQGLFGDGAVGARRELFATTPRRVIGVVTNPVDGALAAQLGVNPHEALVISAVVPGQPAEQAGVRPFDVVVAIDGAKPATLETLRSTLSAKEAKQPVELSIIRHGQPLTLLVNFQEISEATLSSTAVTAPDGVFAWRHDMDRIAPETAREARQWVHDHLEARQRRDQAAAAFKELRDVKIDEATRRELERSMRFAAETLRELNIQTELPEISFVGPEGRDIAVFPRGSVRSMVVDGAAAPEQELAARMREIEMRLHRLESMLQRLIELESKLAPAKEDQPTDTTGT